MSIAASSPGWSGKEQAHEGQVPLEERTPLAPDELERMIAYWRAANYLSVGQIYLKETRCSGGRSAWTTSRPACSATGAPARD